MNFLGRKEDIRLNYNIQLSKIKIFSHIGWFNNFEDF